MAKLNFNALGFLYEDGIRNLRRVFEAASDGLNRHLQVTYDELDEHDRAVKAGADPQIEYDDDGRPVLDYRDILIYHTTTAEEAKGTLNKSIAITAFHLWERSARDWTGLSQKKNFFELRDAVAAKGCPISPRLIQVYLLANLLKHGNEKHGNDLFIRRPDFFRTGFSPEHSHVEWFDDVNLSDDHVAEIFDVIAASGPTPQSIFS